ncbi:GNAT family N-acetyltransferase [Paenibacillus thailandensis]|uniref:GNAT family N-acetyltransferase n=1 Tax=Paenibacillus thailandensis TaxID=393250 RepID=A0ABW5QU81_9BACL
MEHLVSDQWDEQLWLRAEPIYEEAFPEHGRKSRSIVRRMLDRGLAELHVWQDRGAAVAMAITAIDRSRNLLIIDYIAVSFERRGQGLGLACLNDIRAWARNSRGCKGIVIEVEAERTEENEKRIRFWQKAGFVLTDYVRSYIWVPETYKAMYLKLDESRPVPPPDGKTLFKSIINYHEKAYRNRGETK